MNSVFVGGFLRNNVGERPTRSLVLDLTNVVILT